jgi:hypothetical protein
LTRRNVETILEAGGSSRTRGSPFQVNQNTWLDAIGRYLARPKEVGRVKTGFKKLLSEFSAA